MVGVPGRSKACNTCRKRKKSCDHKRPSCSQCRKSGLDCGGYERPRVFVNTYCSSPQPGAEAQAQPASQPAPLSQSLSRSALETAHLAQYWEAYLPDPALPANTVKLSNRAWVSTVHQFYTAESVLKYALLGSSMTGVGRRTGERWMVEEGMRWHSRAVSEMAARLRNSKTSWDDPLLAAARVLCLHQVLYGDEGLRAADQAAAWQRLALGEMALILTRPPESYAAENSHQLFVEARLHIAILGISIRKRTPLSKPQWKTRPWSHRQKTAKDRLVDVIAELPALLESEDMFHRCEDFAEKEVIRAAVMAACRKCDRQLKAWMASNCPANEGKDTPRVPLKVDGWEDLAATHLMSIFWASCVVLYITMRAVSASPAILPARTDPRRYCELIASLGPSFFRPSSGLCGTHLCLFSLVVALRYLNQVEGTDASAPMSPERQVLIGYMKMAKDDGGKSAAFMRSMVAAADEMPLDEAAEV
ncbi:hypothetical protein GQ53DRAFT_841306 [Thozetella sp. PMI_491]|nr:hypothetical protein GQ53DRAFT_841306 [Thozetella sp. PMI_491]